MNRRNLITMVALAAALLVGTGTANAQCFVGCLTPGGSVTQMNLGPAPLRDCGPRETQIKVCGATHRDPQNQKAYVGFTEFCKAFQDAGLPLPSGCPDVGGIHSPTDWSVAGPGGNPAPVRRMLETDPADPFALTWGSTYDGSSKAYDLCGLLKIEVAQPPHGYITLPKSYFHTSKEFLVFGPWTTPPGEKNTLTKAQDICIQECENDRYCVAASLHNLSDRQQGSNVIYKLRCDTYHHNSDLPEEASYSEECDGIRQLVPPYTEQDTLTFCAAKAESGTEVREGGKGSGRVRLGYWWFVRQPDGCIGNDRP